MNLQTLLCSLEHPVNELFASYEVDMNKESNRKEWLQSHFEGGFNGLTPSASQAKRRAMTSSAHRFYRGSNRIFWSDFARDKRLDFFSSPSTDTWLQGDMHADNFGTFSDSTGQILYDINDFDECLIANYQWDLWRLGVSLVLLGRDNQRILTPDNDPSKELRIEPALLSLSKGYLNTIMAHVEGEHSVDSLWSQSNTSGRIKKLLEKVEEKRSRESMLTRWTKQKDGCRVLKEAEDSEGKLTLMEKEQEQVLQKALESLSFRVQSLRNRRLAGTGSLGVLRYYALVSSPHKETTFDTILDIKQQTEPTGLSYIPASSREKNLSMYENDGQRVVKATRALSHSQVEPHLGWLSMQDGFFSIRERNPHKDDLNTQKLHTTKRLSKVAEQWGMILANAHTRGQPTRSEPFSLAVHRQTQHRQDDFHKLVQEVSLSYADQVEQDFHLFCQWSQA